MDLLAALEPPATPPEAPDLPPTPPKRLTRDQRRDTLLRTTPKKHIGRPSQLTEEQMSEIIDSVSQQPPVMAGRTGNSRAPSPANPTAGILVQLSEPRITSVEEVSEDSPPIRETPSSTAEPEEPPKPANEPISMENILEHLPRDQAIFLQGMLAARKYPRTESLDMTSRDTREPKRNFLKP
ncbi:hypothetical protein ACJ73_09447 [Blastomyces percursus]|uniref:Uncharacterized protein n=1 Tax=Blastomyces percursus TaxID=1658174 RepID=A0A1J9P6Z1_9EURO|nr:hypothetical protein ACJ73_09447 [Blastomyces percursus]